MATLRLTRYSIFFLFVFDLVRCWRLRCKSDGHNDFNDATWICMVNRKISKILRNMCNIWIVLLFFNLIFFCFFLQYDSFISTCLKVFSTKATLRKCFIQTCFLCLCIYFSLTKALCVQWHNFSAKAINNPQILVNHKHNTITTTSTIQRKIIFLLFY